MEYLLKSVHTALNIMLVQIQIKLSTTLNGVIVTNHRTDYDFDAAFPSKEQVWDPLFFQQSKFCIKVDAYAKSFSFECPLSCERVLGLCKPRRLFYVPKTVTLTKQRTLLRC